MGRIDHHEKICTLQTYLLDQGPSNRVIDRSVRKIINGVAVASKMISREVSRIGLSDLTGETGTINVQGEMVQKLDIYSEKVISAVPSCGTGLIWLLCCTFELSGEKYGD